MYPPGWRLTRRSTVTSTTDDLQPPASTDILVSPQFVHRRPGFWSRPGEFGPDRFLQSGAVRDRFAGLHAVARTRPLKTTTTDSP